MTTVLSAISFGWPLFGLTTPLIAAPARTNATCQIRADAFPVPQCPDGQEDQTVALVVSDPAEADRTTPIRDAASSFFHAESTGSADSNPPVLKYERKKNPFTAAWRSNHPTDPGLTKKDLLPILARKPGSESSKRSMPVIAPRPGIDYKLIIISADPTVDPKMLIPVEQPSPDKLAKQ